ncbi:hypothetical protein AB0I60_23135 [Actinosynnema sp. NPDC050436]|uniref:hypothetical protein n=1 Tax=Actinosynnema sp. NPDC050436 TaxID=3155659 RepID=UPI0033D1FA96
MDQQHPEPDLPAVEQDGRHVLLRHRDETGPDRPVPGTAPLGPGQLLVLATPGAHRLPALVAALPELLRPLLDPDVESVWLGVAGLAAGGAAGRLAEELGVEVVAPDGGVVAVPGAALYAGHTAGGTGWHRFRPGRLAGFHGARFPLPDWESWVPAVPVEEAGVVAVPAPCGLLVLDHADADRGEAAFRVPVNQRFPKVVVGAGGPVPPASAVAALLAGLPDRPLVVVPGSPGAASHVWLADLALRLGRDVVFTAGVQVGSRTGASSTVVRDAAGRRLFRPFPLVLRQPASGGDQQVLDIAPPPPGWERDGRRSYRLADGVVGGGVVADVVPSGLVLRSADEPVDASAEAVPFDPERWTLTLGTPGGVVGLPVLTAAEDVLAVLPAWQRAAARVTLAGVLDEPGRRALDRWAGPPAPSQHLPPVATTSAVPVPTGSVAGSAHPSQAGAVWPPATGQAAGSSPGSPVAGAGGVPHGVPIAAPAGGLVGVPVAAPVGASVPQRPVTPLVVPVRASTAAEQARFTASARESFPEALATVNAALATWPAMRVDESAGAKADYVAVCLFLGRGEGSSRVVNAALRDGRAGGPDGQVACLTSGVRRLPTHRRAVLRQGRVDESLEHRSPPGSVLVEPGFLAASTDLGVTVPGADLDVLIWPVSAHRTSELALGRQVDEAVFLSRARFKALAVRTAQDRPEEEPDGTPAVPKVAVLFRELAPGEEPATTELDERDLAVLAKLDGVLTRRHGGPVRLVDDPDAVARLTTSLVAWQPDAGRTSAVAS